MSRIQLKYILLFLLITGAALSCKVTRPYQQPNINTNALYRDQTATDTATIASMPWQNLFTDTILKGLIKEGLDHNLDLKVAVQKIAEAQAALGQTKGALFPSLSANASVTPSKQSAAALDFPPGININTNTNAYQLGLSSSWEADIWGKLSSAKRSALCKFAAN